MAMGGHVQVEKPLNKRDFTCPTDMVPHLEKVLKGEYDISVAEQKDNPLLILDIGANCGAFTVYAKLKWPNCEVDAYEPLEANYEYLKSNTKGFSGVTLHMSAVGDPTKDKLYLGKHNVGENSQYPNPETTDNYVEIDVVDPYELLSYDIVKMDCEGAEVYILARLDLKETKYVMFEYHGERNRIACDGILVQQGFALIEMNVTSIGYGVAKYKRIK
jgi:FkbM family methyltransferase